MSKHSEYVWAQKNIRIYDRASSCQIATPRLPNSKHKRFIRIIFLFVTFEHNRLRNYFFVETVKVVGAYCTTPTKQLHLITPICDLSTTSLMHSPSHVIKSKRIKLLIVPHNNCRPRFITFETSMPFFPTYNRHFLIKLMYVHCRWSPFNYTCHLYWICICRFLTGIIVINGVLTRDQKRIIEKMEFLSLEYIL